MKSIQTALCCTNRKICETNLFTLHWCETRRKPLFSSRSAYISQRFKPKIELRLTDKLKNGHFWNSAITYKRQEMLVRLASVYVREAHRQAQDLGDLLARALAQAGAQTKREGSRRK